MEVPPGAPRAQNAPREQEGPDDAVSALGGRQQREDEDRVHRAQISKVTTQQKRCATGRGEAGAVDGRSEEHRLCDQALGRLERNLAV